KYGVDLKFTSAEGDQTKQIASIKTFITQGVDLIAFSPVVETGYDAVLQEAKSAGIPVVLTDRAAVGGDDVDAAAELVGTAAQGREGGPDELGAVRADLDGGEVGAGLDRERPEDTGLASRAGAEVEPAGGDVGADLGVRHRDGEELRPLVLHRRPSLAHGRHGAGVAGVEDDAEG
ncbi:hypothetical protein DLM45_16575, partial [Hyphomicrobium methylovorum]|nr:hypothetical protein [Hyphomicrobium methylovorum]